MLLNIAITMEAEACSLLAATVASSNIFRKLYYFSATVQCEDCNSTGAFNSTLAAVTAVLCLSRHSSM